MSNRARAVRDVMARASMPAPWRGVLAGYHGMGGDQRHGVRDLRVLPGIDAAATVPALPWAAAGLLIGGVLFLAGGVVLIAVPLRRAR